MRGRLALQVCGAPTSGFPPGDSGSCGLETLLFRVGCVAGNGVRISARRTLGAIIAPNPDSIVPSPARRTGQCIRYIPLRGAAAVVSRRHRGQHFAAERLTSWKILGSHRGG